MGQIKDKKIAIVGIGGVGGYLAGMITKQFPHVTVVARNQRKQSIEEKGVVLHSEYHGEIVGHPERVCTASELEPQDFIFICVKNYSLEAACREISHAVTDHTVVIPVMNGVDPGERTRKYLGKGLVADALIYIISFVNSDFSITQQGKFADIYLGIEHASAKEQEKVVQAAQILQEAGIDQHVASDIQAAIWKKYILNCAYNVATAYYNETIGQLRSDKKKAEEFETLIREAFQVALAKGICVTEEDVGQFIHKFYYEYGDDATSSLMRDVAEHKRSELETFSGYLVREAKRVGISVPISEKMYRGLLVREEEQSRE